MDQIASNPNMWSGHASLNNLEYPQNFNETNFKIYAADGFRFLEPMRPEEAQRADFMLRSPTPILVVTVAYIGFVCVLGPAIMQSREPFKLKSIIRFYNLIMVALAALLLYKLMDAIGSIGSLFDCETNFSLNDNSASKIHSIGNWILLIRMSEYLDTIFFTLRKKQNQVTFLHVFHHAFVPLYAYWVLRTAPTRFNVFIIVINSFIHVLMYSYYFLATFQDSLRPQVASKDPNGSTQRVSRKRSFCMFIVSKLLMFKIYMTQLQILQFVAVGVYALRAAFKPNQCNVPWTYVVANELLALTFLGLFLHFYLQAYKSNARAKNKTK